MAEFNSAALLQIIGSDLVLSGDNAVVIGLAVQHLRQPLRRRAVLLGTVGAIVLRVVFTVFATFLLTVPLLSALGGITLFWIGYIISYWQTFQSSMTTRMKFKAVFSMPFVPS